jgi:hypothetical protein
LGTCRRMSARDRSCGARTAGCCTRG